MSSQSDEDDRDDILSDYIRNTRSEFEREMKSRLVRMKANIQLQQVDKYSAQILKAKENDWLKKVETSYEDIYSVCIFHT